MLLRGGGRRVVCLRVVGIRVTRSFLIISEILLSSVGADAYRAASFKLQALTGVQPTGSIRTNITH